MHTLKVIFGGFLLLGVCLLLGRWISGATAMVVATTIKYFIVLWLAATLVNMWVGVSKAGYSIKDDGSGCFARICGPRDHFNSDLVENLLRGGAMPRALIVPDGICAAMLWCCPSVHSQALPLLPIPGLISRRQRRKPTCFACC